MRWIVVACAIALVVRDARRRLRWKRFFFRGAYEGILRTIPRG